MLFAVTWTGQKPFVIRRQSPVMVYNTCCLAEVIAAFWNVLFVLVRRLTRWGCRWTLPRRSKMSLHLPLNVLLYGHGDAGEESTIPLQLADPLLNHLSHRHDVTTSRLDINLLKTQQATRVNIKECSLVLSHRTYKWVLL